MYLVAWVGPYCRTFHHAPLIREVHYVSIPISPLIRLWTSMLDHIFTRPVTCLSIYSRRAETCLWWIRR